MTQLPYDPDEVLVKVRKYRAVMALHHELASYYRTKSKDRKTIAAIWARIDALESELHYMGVVL